MTMLDNECSEDINTKVIEPGDGAGFYFQILCHVDNVLGTMHELFAFCSDLMEISLCLENGDSAVHLG